MEKAKRSYTEEFKRNAPEMLKKPGKTEADVARDLGIGSGEINRWRCAAEQEQQGEGKAFPGKGLPAMKDLPGYSEKTRTLKRRMKY